MVVCGKVQNKKTKTFRMILKAIDDEQRFFSRYRQINEENYNSNYNNY